MNNMKKIICLVSTWLCAACAFSQIEGNVFDQKENGIANATVTAIDSTGKLIVTDSSDNRGFYSLKGLKPGKYKIETRAAGFLLSLKKNVDVPKEATAPNQGYDTYYAIRVDITLIKANTR
jgi:hypothetical protein